ncbi:vWA domain-containing protein [Rhizobium wuzhouense]|uniref:VWFA domain-containing protein n=1 Tax=Rhizobium wuzhouense TaxID=1986026 RepID=A0ABX5NPL8_9HYPH|nr:VWA domain-containing protein [Rhizobium wuzhouense]PYB69890.1 hypothetical protein DMY87_22960 [Rhizobium wuzhouense]
MRKSPLGPIFRVLLLAILLASGNRLAASAQELVAAGQTAACIEADAEDGQTDPGAELRGPFCVNGQFDGDDQDFVNWSIEGADAGKIWTVKLAGGYGTQVRAEIHAYLPSGEGALGPALVTLVAEPQTGAAEAQRVFLPAGTYLIGLSHAGPDTTWSLTATEAPATGMDQQSGRAEPGKPVHLDWPFSAADARRQFRFDVDIPLGSIASVAISQDGKRQTSVYGEVTAPLSFDDLGFSAGPVSIDVNAVGASPFDFRVTRIPEGPRRPLSEDEPNETPADGFLLPLGKAVSGRTSRMADVDSYRFTVTPQLAERRLELQLESPRGEPRQLCISSSGGAPLQCKSGSTLSLGNLVLPPGDYAAVVSGSAPVGDVYRLLLRQAGRRVPGHEVEPNDTATTPGLTDILSASADGAAPDAQKTEIEGLLTGADTDRFLLRPEGEPQLWKIVLVAAGSGGSAGSPVSIAVEDAQGHQRAIRQGAADGTPILLDRMLLSPEANQIVVSGTDARYKLTVESGGKPEPGMEREPNDSETGAERLEFGILRSGEIADLSDTDRYRFSISTPVHAALTITPAEGRQIAWNVARGLAKPDQPSGLADGSPSVLDAVWELGTYQISLNALANDVSGYQVKLDLLDPFLPPAGGAAQPPNLPLDMKLQLTRQTLAAYWPRGQRVAGTLRIENRGGEALAVRLDAQASVHQLTLDLPNETTPIAPGEAVELPVSLLARADAWKAAAAMLTVRARDDGGGQATASAMVAISDDVDPATAADLSQVPPSMRGGLDLALPAFGGSIVPDAGDPAGSSAAATLFDGLMSSDGYVSDLGTGPREVTVALGGREPQPVNGILLHPYFPSAQAPDELLADFELELSPDGTRFEPALKGRLQPVNVEQAFPLPQPIVAKVARLRLLSSHAGMGRVGLGEFKVVANPGVPGGVSIDVGKRSHGGHLVWSSSQIGADYDDGSTMLTDGAPSQTIAVSAGEAPEFVIGFADDRQAVLGGIEWTDDPATAEAERLGEMEISASTESALGPFTVIGVLPVEHGATTRKLAFSPATPVRFLRFSARQAASVSGTLKLPAHLSIAEVPIAADALPINGEWGMDQPVSQADFFRRPAEERPPVANLTDGDSEVAPRDLAFTETISDAVQVDIDTDWFVFAAPEGVERVMIDLTGEPLLAAVVEMTDTDGKSVALRTISSGPRRQQVEAPVTAGGRYRLKVFEPPRSVAIAYDASGSIAGFLPIILAGLNNFSEGIRPGREAVNIMPFELPFLMDKWSERGFEVAAALSRSPPGGTTSGLERTLLNAMDGMADRPGAKAILVITDAASSGYDLQPQLWKRLGETRTRIFAAHIGAFDHPLREKQLLQDLVAANGGVYASARTQPEMDVVYERVSAYLRRPAYYTLSIAKSEAPPPLPGAIEVAAPPQLAAGSPAPAAPSVDDKRPRQAALELILDASGSMLQRLDGKQKIEIAQSILTQLTSRIIPPGTPTALRVFGDTAPDSCETNLRSPLSPLDPGLMAANIGMIRSINLSKTPIAASLSAVAGDLAANTGPKLVVLVTDGEETCGGDPEQAIAALRASGVDVRVNIVGFAIDNEDLKKTFRDWAEKGGGTFLDAADAKGLAAAMEQAVIEPFSVLDANGRDVASGTVGGPAVPVPAGTYRVVVGGAGDRAFEQITVREGKTSRVELARP